MAGRPKPSGKPYYRIKWVKSLIHARLFTTPWIVACTKLLCPWDFSRKSTGVGCHFLLQGIFPNQGSNPGLSHCRQMLYRLSHPGRVLLHKPGQIAFFLGLNFPTCYWGYALVRVLQGKRTNMMFVCTERKNWLEGICSCDYGTQQEWDVQGGPTALRPRKRQCCNGLLCPKALCWQNSLLLRDVSLLFYSDLRLIVFIQLLHFIKGNLLYSKFTNLNGTSSKTPSQTHQNNV